MRKTLRFLACFMLFQLLLFSDAFGQCKFTASMVTNGTSGNSRTPNANYKTGMSVYLLTPTECTSAGLTTGMPISGIEWYNNLAPTSAATVSLKVYLQNTTDASYTKGTTFSTAISSMTLVHNNASHVIPASLTQSIPTFSGSGTSSFTYTGGGIYVAFEMENCGSTVSGMSAYCNISLTGGICTYQTTTACNSTGTLGVSNFRPITAFYAGTGTPVTPTLSIAPLAINSAATTITATSTNTGTGTVTYNFVKNSVSQQKTTSNIWNATGLVNGDSISCEMKIVGSACITTDTVVGNHVIANIASCTPTSSTINDTICGNTTYFFNGQNLNTTGIYKDTLENYAGCDSVITLNLTVNQAPIITVAQGATSQSCDTSTVSFTTTITNQKYLHITAPNDVVMQIGTATFGPSIATNPLNFSDIVYVSPTNGCTTITNNVAGKVALIDRGTCTFSSKVANAQAAGAVGVIIANNQINATAPNMAGSDPSIVIPSISVSQADGNTIKTWLQSGPVAGNTYYHTDSYKFIYKNGTDSIITSASTQTLKVTNSNAIIDVYVVDTTTGCKSNVISSDPITVKHGSSSTTTYSSCGSYTWNDTTYTSTGTYTFTTEAYNGCDSVATLNLTVTPIVYDTTVINTNANYTWAVNNQTYSSSGYYSSVNGCQTHVLNLTIQLIPAITITDTFAYSTTCSGSSGSAQHITVSGSNLIGDIHVAAPSGFEVSLSNNSGFDTAVNLTPVTGAVSPTLVYIRISSLAIGALTGNLVCSSTGGATSQTLSLTGNANATPDITQPSNQNAFSYLNTSAITFSGSVSGTTYNWVNNDTTIGLAASGSGDISSFTANNTTNVPVTATVTVTPVKSYYVGNPESITMPNQTGTFLGNVRGYWFTAPANFRITSLFIPTDASTGNQSIAVVKFNNNAQPPVYSTTTNNFTLLYLTQNDATSGAISVDIPVNSGEVIGILGQRNTTNSYAPGNYQFNIGGTPVTINRLGMQFPLTNNTPQSLWTEAGGSISRVLFEYQLGNSCIGVSKSFDITVNPVNASINTVDTLAAFSACIGSVSSEHSFSINGGQLLSDIKLVAPSGFQISTTSGSGFADSLILAKTGDTVVATTIYSRLSGNVIGSYSGNIVCTTLGKTKNIAVSGIVHSLPTILLNNDTTVCATSNITLHASGAAVYAWSSSLVNSGTWTPLTGATDGIYSTTAMASSIYSVIGTDTNGCQNTNQVTVTVNPLPVASIDTTGNAACFASAGNIFTLNGSSSDGNPTWSVFNNPNALTINWNTATNINSPSVKISGGTGGNVVFKYTVTSNQSPGCGVLENYITVKVVPKPTVDLLPNLDLCTDIIVPAMSFTSQQDSAANPVTYTWSNINPNVGLSGTNVAGSVPSFTTQNSSDITIYDGIKVTPSIVVNNNLTCLGTETLVRTIAVKPTPRIELNNPKDTLICNGLPLKLDFTTHVTSHFSWTSSGNFIGMQSNSGNDSIPAFTTKNTNGKFNAVHNFIIKIDTVSGCAGNTLTFPVIVKQSPYLFSILGDSICSGSLYTFVPSFIDTTTHMTWRRVGPNGVNDTSIGANIINEVLNSNNNLNYTNALYQLHLTVNGCAGDTNFNVVVKPVPAGPTFTMPTIFCHNTSYINLQANRAPYANELFTWSATADSNLYQNQQYAIVKFALGKNTIRLKSEIIGSGCVSAIYSDSLDNAPTTFSDPYIIKKEYMVNDSLNHIVLVCLHNPVQNYHWGRTSKATLQEDNQVYADEKGQELYFKNTTDFDTSKYYYWVKIVTDSEHNCTRQIYYNAPFTNIQNHPTIVLVNNDPVEMSVYPNPAQENVNIELKGNVEGIYQIQITDITGKQIQTFEMSDRKQQFGIDNLSSGYYLISCWKNGTKLSTSKLIKN